MKKAAQVILASALLFLAGLTASAQDGNAFFRSRQDAGYYIPFNGNCWWEDGTFRNGSIFYNGKQYDDVPLNINANTQHALVMRKGEVVPLVLETEMVRWLSIDNDYYVNLRLLGYQDASEGFYKLVSNGPMPVFKRVNKNLRSDTGDANGALIGYYDPQYRSNVTNFFEKVDAVYCMISGEMVPLRNRNSVKKLCDKQQKKELRKAVKAMGVTPKQLSLEQYAALAASIVSPGSEGGIVLMPSFNADPSPMENVAAVMGKNVDTAVKVDEISQEWFQPEDLGGTVKYVSGMPVVAIYRNKVYELGIKNKRVKGPVLIQGVVTDSEEGKPVAGAVVFEKNTADYVVTDEKGVWSLEVPLGETVITFSENYMEEFPVMVNVYDKARLDVVMSPKSEMLQGVVISADARAAHRTPRMGVEKLSVKSISRVPTAFGEGDVLKAVQSLPGVQSVGEASSGINVRGGSSDQNLILYNGSTIYNPTHMFGVFSAFDPNMVEGVELYKSSIPAEYGGRLSSVMDVSGKDGSFEKFKGALGLGVLTSHAMIETPLGKEKRTSMIVGGRTTYSNYLMGLLPSNSGYSGGKASFADVSARLTHKIKESNVIRANMYWSNDSFGFSGDTTFRYSNLNASLQWDNQLNKKTRIQASAGYDMFKANMKDMHDMFESFSHTIGVNQLSAKLAVNTQLTENHNVSMGAEVVRYIMNPGELMPIDWDLEKIEIAPDQDPNEIHSTLREQHLDKENGTQTAMWLSDTWVALPGLTIDGGVRISSFSTPGALKPFSNPEMRISAKYTQGSNLSFKAGFNTMSQYIHLISNTTSISPMDVWKLADDKVKPQTGWQASAGGYLTAFNGVCDFSVESYFKRSFHGLDYKSGANLFMNSNIANALVETTGKAYGVEIMAKKTTGALNGWVSYTYSRSLLREVGDRGLAAINEGEWYCAPYDKPHSFQVVGNYEFTHRYSLSFNMDYSTGRPVTVPIGHYYYENQYHLLYSRRNEYRIPDYFRLDLALNIEPGHKLTKLTHFSCTLGVYNVTGRKNAYSVYYTTNGSEVKGHMVSIFAVPVPYASINMKF